MSGYREPNEAQDEIKKTEDMDSITDSDEKDDEDDGEPVYVDGSSVNECWAGGGIIRKGR